MLVSRIIGTCPGCGGKDCFGVVLVHSDHLLRGCGRCSYREQLPVPGAPLKKILYLDQNFYSAAFENYRDPRKGQRELVRLMDRIRMLTDAQVLAVPRSSIHEDEARQWKYREELLDFLKTATRGHMLERPYRVERAQLLKSFQAWLSGAGVDYQFDSGEALPRDIQRWDGYFFVDVQFDRGDGSAERSRKLGSAENLVALFDEWRDSTSSFNDDFRGELSGQARLYLANHEEVLHLRLAGDPAALMSVSTVERVWSCLPRGTERAEGWRQIVDFFASDHFANVPVHSITCRTHAALKHEVKNGMYPVRKNALEKLRGYYTDLDHIAHYAPYCDAIAVDKAMAEMMKKPGVALESRYDVRVFSLNSVPQFHAWLDELEASITDDLRGTLRLIYGCA